MRSAYLGSLPFLLFVLSLDDAESLFGGVKTLYLKVFLSLRFIALHYFFFADFRNNLAVLPEKRARDASSIC